FGHGLLEHLAGVMRPELIRIGQTLVVELLRFVGLRGQRDLPPVGARRRLSAVRADGTTLRRVGLGSVTAREDRDHPAGGKPGAPGESSVHLGLRRVRGYAKS